MPIYWGRSSIPELAGLDRAESRRIWFRCYLKAMRDWQFWAGVTACGFLAGFGALAGGIWGGIICGAIGGFFYGQALVEIMRPHIRKELESKRQRRSPEDVPEG